MCSSFKVCNSFGIIERCARDQNPGQDLMIEPGQGKRGEKTPRGPKRKTYLNFSIDEHYGVVTN